MRNVVRTVGYAAAGAVVTALLAVGLLGALQPLREPVYDALYLGVGPWTATTTAWGTVFLLGTLPALAVPTLAEVSLRGAGEGVAPLAGGFLAAAVLGVALLAGGAALGVPTVLAVAAVALAVVVAVPLGVRALGLWPRGVAAFAGGVPVLVALVVLLGVGLGWGGGYDVVATELPAGANASATADFAEAPALRADLLAGGAGYCSVTDDRRTCRLPLRDYGGEAHAARFLARHGARCPLLGTGDESAAFVAADGDTAYRVRCVAYGD